MKAVVINSPQAGPVCGDFAGPAPAQGEQVFELVGAGLHQIVRSIASVSHDGSGDVDPFVPGVDAVARGVDGGLVYTGFITEPWGTMAERMSARLGIPVPDGADPHVGSGAGAATAADLLKQLPGLLARFADGRIQIPYRAFTLADAAAAWAHRGLERAVLVPSPGAWLRSVSNSDRTQQLLPRRSGTWE